MIIELLMQIVLSGITTAEALLTPISNLILPPHDGPPIAFDAVNNF